jgi:Domain of unknown function (DUF4253)
MTGLAEPWPLPDGLPPGRLVVPDPKYGGSDPVTEPVLWVTDEPVPHAGPLFARLMADHDRTRLWPLLLTTLVAPRILGASREITEAIRRGNPPGRPWHTGELAPVPRVELDPNRILAERWKLSHGQDREEFDFGADAVPTAAFRSWPGLAEPASAGPDPDAYAASLAGSPGGLEGLTRRADPPYLGLVPASDGASAITACGWMSQAGDAAEIAAVIGSWQQRFGARLCSLGFDTLGVSVAWPPATAERARRVAAEHFAFCEDIADFTALDDYARSLAGARAWTFWWD